MWYKIFGNGVHNGMKRNVTLKISTEELGTGKSVDYYRICRNRSES